MKAAVLLNAERSFTNKAKKRKQSFKIAIHALKIRNSEHW